MINHRITLGLWGRWRAHHYNPIGAGISSIHSIARNNAWTKTVDNPVRGSLMMMMMMMMRMMMMMMMMTAATTTTMMMMMVMMMMIWGWGGWGGWGVNLSKHVKAIERLRHDFYRGQDSPGDTRKPLPSSDHWTFFPNVSHMGQSLDIYIITYRII